MASKKLSGVYIMISQDGSKFYAGQTKDLASRYDRESRNRIVAFKDIPVEKYGERLHVETEAILFLQAFGLPIWNKKKVNAKLESWSF